MIEYEWAVETDMPEAEDFETDYFVRYETAHRFAGGDPGSRIKLVRRDNNGDTLEAYVIADTLDKWFRGPNGQLVCKTPKRFHAEVYRVADEECGPLVAWAGIPDTGYRIVSGFSYYVGHPNSGQIAPQALAAGTAIPTDERGQAELMLLYDIPSMIRFTEKNDGGTPQERFHEFAVAAGIRD